MYYFEMVHKEGSRKSVGNYIGIFSKDPIRRPSFPFPP